MVGWDATGIEESRSGHDEAPPGAVLVIGQEGTSWPTEAALAAVGARTLGRISWHEVHRRFDQQSAAAVVVAEAAGVEDTILAEMLPHLAHWANDSAARIVLTLESDQIDLIAGVLDGPNIDLLCAPTQAERVAALSFAGVNVGDKRDQFQDVGRETEAARLRRLHEEVARIAETLARLTRDEPVRGDDARRGVRELGLAYHGAPPEHVQIAPREIREAIRARRLRDQFFGMGLFEDPAWDMLLDLFAAELERAQVSVSSLCIAAAVAPTTALRWIARMTEAGLFERQPDPFDRRRAFMGLSARASAGMRSYVAAVRRFGSAVV